MKKANSGAKVESLLTPFKDFVQEKLPGLNEDVVARRSCPFQLATKISEFLTKEVIDVCLIGSLPREQAISILIPLSFCVSSIARHLNDFRVFNSPFEVLPKGVEQALLHLASISGLPPRDSSYTTWILNRGQFNYQFDNNPGWRYFYEAVNTTDEENQIAVENLEIITKGYVRLDSENAIDFIRIAYESINRILKKQALAPKKNENGNVYLDPIYFLSEFRSYFLPFEVGGVLWHGSNAANVASCAAIDIVLGLVEPWYVDIIKARFRYYSIEDREYISRLLESPSIMDLFVESIGLSNSLLEVMTEDVIRNYSASRKVSFELRKSFLEFSDLISLVGRLTRLHFGLINTYLVKPFEQMGKCPMGFSGEPTISPLSGTGGASHDDTKQIRDLRLFHPRVEKLRIFFE